MRLLQLLGLAFILWSCSSNGDDDPSNMNAKNESVLAFEQVSFPLATISDEDQFPGLSATYNEAFGRMELHDERGLSLFLSEDTISCQGKKEEIESGIFQIEYLVDDNRILAYKSSLPDGSESYHHLFAALDFNGISYIAESDPLVSYNEHDLNRLIALVNTLRYHTPKTDNPISTGNS